jgi:mutator protein MutT
VLIAQRPAGKHLAGSWEFPGGKLGSGEARVAGLARELREEIGIEIWRPRPLIRVRHEYPQAKVLLDVWVVRRFRGDARGLDGQKLRWLRRRELALASAGGELLPADQPIVAALNLPERLRRASTRFYRVNSPNVARAVGGARKDDQNAARRAPLLGAHCSNTDEAVAAAAAGFDFLVMREALEQGALAALCANVDVPVFGRGLALERAWQLGASGISDLK